MEYNPNPVVNAVPTPAEQHRKDGVTAMVLGIIGLALSWWGVLTVAGLILSILALSRAKKNREFAEHQCLMEAGQNKAGYICGLIGVIVSAVMLFFIIVCVVLIVVFGVYFAGEALPEILDKIPDAAALPSFLALL